MTRGTLSTRVGMSRRSPPEFADAEARIATSTENRMPPIGNLSADDVATTLMPPMLRLPRRRHLSSDDSKAKTHLPPKSGMPTESSEPSSTRGAGQSNGATQYQLAEPRVDHASEGATTDHAVTPRTVVSERPSDPSSRVRKTKAPLSPVPGLSSETREPSSTRGAGHPGGATHCEVAEPRVEPPSEDATTNRRLPPKKSLSACSSEPTSRARKTSTRVSPSENLSSETREPSSSGDTAMTSLSPISRLPKPLEPTSAAADGHSRSATHRETADAAAEPSSRNGAGQDQCGSHDTIADPLREPSLDDDAATPMLSTKATVPASSEPFVTGAAARVEMPTTFFLPATHGHTINAIRELDRQRDDLLRAEGNMTRQVKAICRRAVDLRIDDASKVRAAKMKQADALYDALDSQDELDPMVAMRVGSTLPLLDARRAISANCAKVTSALVKEVKKLPVYKSFVEQVNGFGALGLGQIIGKCGDLNLYANPAKVWKRMGLGLVGGERQRKCTDAAKAVLHGYSPRRRSTMYVIGDSLIKKQSPYRELYLRRKEFEVAKATAAGMTVRASTDAKAAPGEKVMSQMHVHRRGQRYAEKRLLRDLWRAWTGRAVEYHQEA